VHFSETRLWILPCNRYGLPCPYGSDSILDMSVDPSFQAQLVLRSGLAALVPGMFGMGWLGSGLGMPCVHAHCHYSFRCRWNPCTGIFHSLHPQGQGSAPKLPRVIRPAGTKDEKAVYCRSYFGIHGNRNSQHDRLRHSPSGSGSCIGRYCGRTPFPAPRQDFSSGPLLFLGDRDNALVRFLRILVPFQYARGVEQHRDGRSALG
jgi:hypothetical protein